MQIIDKDHWLKTRQSKIFSISYFLSKIRYTIGFDIVDKLTISNQTSVFHLANSLHLSCSSSRFFLYLIVILSEYSTLNYALCWI